MGVDIKWEGLDKLQDNLEKAATLDDIKRVVRHQEKTLLETAQEHAVKKSAGGEFLAVGIQSLKDYSACVEYGTRRQPPEPFMEPTAREAGEKFVRDLRKLFK